jgi:hypothetical protein
MRKILLVEWNGRKHGTLQWNLSKWRDLSGERSREKIEEQTSNAISPCGERGVEGLEGREDSCTLQESWGGLGSPRFLGNQGERERLSEKVSPCVKAKLGIKEDSSMRKVENMH